MQCRHLGNSSVNISPIIFGAWAIGGWMWGGSNEDDAIAAIHASIDNGVTTIDTAAIYGMGYSEELVGKAIKGRRDKVVIATKCGFRWDTDEGSDPWPQKDNQGKDVTILKNSKPASIAAECENSLKRLGVDAIDLYQIHSFDSSTPVEESWEAMVQLKKQGKVKAIGVSNYKLPQLTQAHNLYPVDSLQPPFSLLRRGIENDLLPFCQKNNIAVLAYSPLERGLLTGKVGVNRSFAPGDHRANLANYTPENRKRILEALGKIQPIADKHHAALSQIILACTLHYPGITAVIAGARNAQQAAENAKALALALSAEEQEFIMKEINSTIIQ